jgi:hypothetical protein
MASGGSENSITGDVASAVQAQVVYGGITFNYNAPTSPAPAPTEPWARLVHGSKAWRDGQDRSPAIAVAEHLAALHRDIPDDPWLDRTLAERFSKRVSWLAGRLEIEFGPAEATLLTLVPLLHQALWTRAAADRLPAGPPKPFYREHSRLAARMEGHDEVRWWLFHRWLWLQAEVLKPESIATLLTGVDTPPVLTPARVSGLLQGLRIEPNVLCGKQRLAEMRQRETLFGGTDDEQHVRTPLLGLLLAVAYGMAIDATGLSDIIVWHTPVDFPRLHATIAEASWDFRADCPVLSATCHHASVVEALREHTVRFDALLHAVRQATEFDALTPLRALPERASSDDVRPAAGPDGKPVFSGWSRFRMDEQRVQELLMGEQLYRDRSLAIRELYQNALDACRYRQAREEYLRRTTGRFSDWSGQITFTQGVDEDGRPYLDCADNGIGMGISELTGVFAHAGGRFADLAEFRDEQVDWSRLDPPVELYPNSRFGIGVLSYFMLADEITIMTCRMSRYGGLPDPTYQVEITGPGHLFEIRKLADQGRPGTTVRLHLRADVQESCVETLSRLLAIAEFDTTARHDDAQATWTAGRFESRPGQVDLASGSTVASADGHVIWCMGEGGLLVDGLRVEPGPRDPAYQQYGSLVNLVGPLAPRLSVDRNVVVDDVYRRIADLQAKAVPDLVATNTLLSGGWLRDRGFDNPALADLVTDRSPEHRCFPADEHLLTGRQRINRNSVDGHPLDHVFLWRLIANSSLGELADLVPDLAEAGTTTPPRPSDLRILCDSVRQHRWASDTRLRTPGHIVAAAADLGAAPRSVARRLTELGIDGIEVGCFPDDRERSYHVDLDLLSKAGTGFEPWRQQSDLISMSDITHIAVRQGISASEAIDIVTAYGLAVAPAPDAGRKHYDSLAELVVFARDHGLSPRDLTDDDLPDWLDASVTLLSGITDVHAPVPLGHVLSKARLLALPTYEVVRRLSAMGLTPPDLPGPPSVDDVRLVSVDLNGAAPWLDIRQPVRLHHLIKAHAVLNQSPVWAADRLSHLGFTVRSENLPYYPEYRDVTLLRDGEFNDGFLDPDRPVPLARLVSLSRQLSSPLNQIVDRLRELGMHVPDLATTVRNALAKVPLEG